MIYIGNFLHATNQEKITENDRRHGEFNLIVEADSEKNATEMFKTRILELRENSAFFEGRCEIYFVQLLAFDKLPDTYALMFNYKSLAGDPLMPFIKCSLPNRETDACKIYNWDETPEVDGRSQQLFLTFQN